MKLVLRKQTALTVPVAPRAGAWIETSGKAQRMAAHDGRPPRGGVD